MTRVQLARIGLRGAIEVRRRCRSDRDAPICVYDLAESLGIEVWFFGGPSFGGTYAKGYERLFVPSERPAGRKAFTCAHELAHWYFGHGSRVEDMDFDRSDHEIPEELLANTFASYLLMPRHAITTGFARRNVEPSAADAMDVYSVACELGVGYVTLLKHMRWSLNLMSLARMTDLLAVPPKEIRRAVLGSSKPGHMVLAGTEWRTVAIDIEVGDTAVLPRAPALHGRSAIITGECSRGTIVEGVRTGLTQAIVAEAGNWSAMIRVSRRQYTGRAAYRHLEDPDEDEHA
jgi:IrrE N-terminal-like domain